MSNRRAFFAVIVMLAGILHGCQTASNTNGNANVSSANRNEGASARNGNRSREEFDRDRDSIAQQARNLGRRIGSGADDLWIWTNVRASLAAADDLRDSTINVDVDNNVVTLTGTVPENAQKSRAEQVVKGTEGVTGVKNELQISQSGGNANRGATNTNRNSR